LELIITDRILKITVLCGKLNTDYATCLRDSGNILGSFNVKLISNGVFVCIFAVIHYISH